MQLNTPFSSSKYSGPKTAHHSNLTSSLHLTTVDCNLGLTRLDHVTIRYLQSGPDYTDVQFLG